MESRDASFFENMFPVKDMHNTSGFSFKIIPEPIVSVESSEQPIKHEDILEKDDSEARRRSKRQRVAKSCGDNFSMYLNVDDRKKLSTMRWIRFYPMGLWS